jgi:hypothetical protein
MKLIFYPLAPLCKPRAKVRVLSFFLFKGLRQTNHNSAHKRRIIPCHRVHGFQPSSQKLKWLSSVLAKHRAKLRCQFDLFAEYVAEAERVGTEDYHLYEWTKATIEDPVKVAKYVESFSLYVDDQEVYAKEIADAPEAIGGERPG